MQNFETFDEVYDVMMMPGPVIFSPEVLNKIMISVQKLKVGGAITNVKQP